MIRAFCIGGPKAGEYIGFESPHHVVRATSAEPRGSIHGYRPDDVFIPTALHVYSYRCFGFGTGPKGEERFYALPDDMQPAEAQTLLEQAYMHVIDVERQYGVQRPNIPFWQNRANRVEKEG